MSSRKPGAGAGAGPATLEDNASVENPASSEESSTGIGQELATTPSVKSSASPIPTNAETGETPAEVEVNRDQDVKDAKDAKDAAKESSPAPKTLTATATTRRTPTPTLTPTSDGVATKSVRVTRHSSPLLLLSSPTTSRREVLDALDGEEGGSQTKSSVERSLVPLIRGRKSIKDLKEAKEVKSEEATAELPLKEEPLAEGSESRESQPATDEKDHKDIKDKEKDKKEEKEKEKEKEKEPPPVTTPTTCNRVTRKSHAQEQANNTRVTRNRRQSSTVGSITSAAAAAAAAATSSAATEQPPPLPPARGRRKKPVLAAAVVPAVKRKRSEDAEEEATSAAKYSKVVVVVVKPEDGGAGGETNEEHAALLSGSIKQEPMDASEVSSISSRTVTPTPAPAPSGRRGRGRPQNRNSTSPATSSAAANTRATRLSKAGSPGIVAQEPAPPKRRRVGSSTRKTASASSLAPSSQGGAGDEDSKDSMASSMDDLLLAAADIKQEKLTPDFDESLLTESLPSTSVASVASIASIASANGHSSSSCIEPLTVDTESSKPAKLKESAVAAASSSSSSSVESPSPTPTKTVAPGSAAGKAPSLSPEMISEGVSAVSVRKFYKKPEFLENNLGIEKDPELGEIVQTVSSTSTSTSSGQAMEAEAEADVETADSHSEVAKEEVQLKEEKPIKEEEAVEQQKEKEKTKTKAEPEPGTEPEPETEAAVSETPAEADQVKDESEADLDIFSYSNSSLKSGQLRLDDSNESGQDLPLEDHESDSNDGKLIINGEEVPAAEPESDQEQEQDQQEQSQPQEQQKSEDYDDFEHEIMEELAKEGVLDASGNALSQQATPADAKEEESSQDPSPVDEMVAMEVDESYIDIKQQAADGPDDADDCCPEENKENLSTTSGDAATGEALVVDLPLTLKEEDDNEEEKPLAVMAAEQKQELAPFKLALPLQLELELEEKASNGKKEEPRDEQQQQQRREQEIHLHNLGLLTHQAAEQRRQDLQEAHTRQSQLQQKQQHYHQHSQQQIHHHQQHKRQGARGGGGGGAGAGAGASHVESSGTLKTVIKLNRSSNGGMGVGGGLPTGTVIHGSNSGFSSASSTSSSSVGSATRKSGAALSSGTGTGAGAGAVAGVRRQSLKMTFQKGRARGHNAADRSADQHHAEDSYYTIQNENEGATKSSVTTGNPGRKTNNRSSSTNNHHSAVATTSSSHGSHSAVQYNSSHSEGQGQAEHGFYQMVKTKDEKEKILIPEKASSFKFHPGRLCEDQCYYCSGKFGLYDTPCHVGQIKSVERQQKILANEEKLTVDNCLCDACFRHVDRRANAPSYKKRLSASGHLETGLGNSADKHFAGGEHGVIPEAATGEAGNVTGSSGGQNRPCAVKDCVEAAGHSLRRKCIRKSVKKFQLSLEIPAGTSNVWLCEAHYNTVIQFSGCVLCKRRLGKNHMYNITTDTDRLEKALAEMGIPVQLGMGTAVCKLCRYFANLLMKPPDSTKSQKAEFVKNYRKRLLKVHNLQDGSHEVSEADEEEAPSAAEAVGGSVGDDGHEDAELPMVVDDDGHTDSNSSSSSMTPLDSSKQMSKLQAILQQNLGAAAEAGTSAGGTANSAGGGGGGSGPGSGSGADISNVLRGNPNISMRELFHGEEELGVQFKVPFGCSSSHRTPEGWTRVQTFLQYDEPTRRLWEELQKPYGNQSSFLRHLILLEKYYRNGDLVLAAHASSNASVYTETVRQRLNSFDHGHCGGLGSTPPGSSKRSGGIPQPATTGSVLATALTTPNTATSSSSSSSSAASGSADQPASTEPPVIPLVELNDDDDDDEEHNGGEDATATAALDDSESEAPTRLAESPLERRLTTVSVDKLTKQLSSNAVTIIARPKDKSLLVSNQATISDSASASASASVFLSASNSSSSASAASSPEEVVMVATKAAATVSGAVAPAQSKDAPPLVPTAGSNSRSILKSNLLGMNKSQAAVEIVPLTSAASVSASATATAPKTVVAMDKLKEKQQMFLDDLLCLRTKLKEQQQPGTGAANAGPQKMSNAAQLLSSPPELISLHRRRTSAAAPPAPASTAAASNSLLCNLHGKRLQLPRMPGAAAATAGAATSAGNRGGSGVGSASGGAGPPPNVVKLPDTLTPQERHESKSWKPTLIPLEDQVPNKSHALYQTADGRRLPALVQVQSGGKPYLISIFDYNRMCILRREKLLRDQMLKANAKQKPPNQQQQQQGQGQTQQQQGSAAAFSNMVKLAQQQTARQQLQQLQQKQQQQHLPSLQPGGVVATAAAAGAAVRLARLAPKPMPPLTNPQIGSQAPSFQPLLPPNPLDNSNNSWLWKNFPDPNQYLLNGNGGAGAGGAAGNSASKLPHLTAKPATATSSGGGGGGGTAAGAGGVHKSGALYAIKLHQLQQQQLQQKLIDTAIMSKIPKSLTVIPQQMGGGGGGSSSSSSLGDLGGGAGSSSTGKD